MDHKSLDAVSRMAYLFSEPTTLENIYIPQYHLYPPHPQILHQLMIELFVRAPIVMYVEDNIDHIVVPSGPVFRVGGQLAALRKHIFQHNPTCGKIVLISTISLPPDIHGITTTHIGLHSFFGILPIQQESYAGGFLQSADMFSLYAKDIEAQIPFIRAYKNVSVIPYILNAQKDQSTFDDMVDSIISHHGNNTVVVFVNSDIGKEKIKNYLHVVE